LLLEAGSPALPARLVSAMSSSDKVPANLKRAVLPDSGDHYRAVAAAAEDAIVTINSESTILLANPATEKIFGYSAEELIGRQLTMLMPKHLRMHHRSGVARYLATRQRKLEWNAVQLSGLHKSGHEIPIEISFLEFVKDGQRFFTGIIRKVSERNEPRKEMDEDPQLLSALVHHATIGVSVVDLEGHFTFTNERYCQIVGRTREDLLRISVNDITHADDLSASMALFERAKDFGENFEVEKRYLRLDGSTVWVHNCESVINDSTGKPRGVMAITLDITKQRTT
jgi:two-component system sensor histidine kinase UhpB